MSYQIELYKNAIKAIEKIYEKSKYDPEVDLYRSFDIINSVNDNQIQSKEWLVNQLVPHLKSIKKLQNIAIVGSWYGLLSVILREQLSPDVIITNIDSDSSSKEIGYSLIKGEKYKNNFFVVDDAVDHFLEFNENYEVLINTSCEHIEREDVKLLTKIKTKNTLICFQSNNYHEIDSHINTSNSLEEFVDYLNLREVFYAGTLSFEKYDRYTVIGK